MGNIINGLPDPKIPVPWTAPTLLNSWTNFGSGFSITGYSKSEFSEVELRGLVTGGSNGTAIFTLPVGSRPAYISRRSTVSGDAFAQIEIGIDGNVKALNSPGGFFSLDGIKFRAEL